ncbi:MAG: type II toxin-antitoxin system RelE family toxin [Solirubrobacteraceae bacterium]
MAKVAVELDRQAQRDLRKLHPDDHRAALRAMADVLTHEPLPAKANDRALKGAAPWRRLRVGELRILWRAVGERRRGARVIHRRDLERAVRTLGD